MATWGDRLAAGLAVASLCAPVLLLSGCAESVDQAHTVQTKLGRIARVVDADVSTPSTDRAARIDIVFDPGLRPRDIVELIGDISQVAQEESYPAYRLDLREAGNEGDVLSVDVDFEQSPQEQAVVANWLRVGEVLLGDTTYVFDAGSESVTVTSGGALLHDVTEASRIRYGTTTTTWRFTAENSTYIVEGRVSANDVLLLQRVQRTVVSPSLPVPALTWRLERRHDHVLLDLQLALPDGVLAPRMLTISGYGDQVAPLARAAVAAMDVTGRPPWVRLRQSGAQSNDVFAWWISGQPAVRGRDRLNRGWDTWLRALARQELSRQPAGRAT